MNHLFISESSAHVLSLALEQPASSKKHRLSRCDRNTKPQLVSFFPLQLLLLIVFFFSALYCKNSPSAVASPVLLLESLIIIICLALLIHLGLVYLI